MSAVHDILREEHTRLEELRDQYLVQLESLPKGSIAKKKIRNHEYYYLAYRCKDKVKSDYLGKKDAPKLKEIQSQLARRKEIADKLKRVNNNIKEISKSLRGR